MKNNKNPAQNGSEKVSLKKLETRYKLLNEVEQGRMTQTEAAECMKLSSRQVRRIYAAFQEDGLNGLMNKKIGQPSNNAYSPELKDLVTYLAKENYPGAGPTLLSELLKERHGLSVSRETLRHWLDTVGIREILQQSPRHRRRRTRKASYGIMEQMDTCTHDWFRNGGKAYLIILVDDATSRVYGKFYDSESTRSNMDAIKSYIVRYGRPISLYTDNASHFKVLKKGMNPEEVLCPNDKSKTQIERALEECDISHIHAHSHEGKGRAERNFLTLQDRLEKLLHYDGIKDIDSANEYLEASFLKSYNRKFQVEPTADFNSHLPCDGYDLDAIFSIQVERICNNDFTFSLNRRKFQIARENDLHGLPRKKLLIEKRLGGSVRAKFMGRYLVIHKIQVKKT